MKTFTYLSNQQRLVVTTEKGNVYKMYKHLNGYIVKDEDDIKFFEKHPNFVEVKGGILQIKESTPEPKIKFLYTKEEFKKLKKSEQIEVLKFHGVKEIPKTENNRMELYFTKIQVAEPEADKEGA